VFEFLASTLARRYVALEQMSDLVEVGNFPVPPAL
jgi:hypothetical protein